MTRGVTLAEDITDTDHLAYSSYLYDKTFFQGNKPSGGYSVEIKDILIKDDKLVINAVEQQPGRNCMTTMAITQPYHLVTVEQSDLPVQFNLQTEIVNCE
ncbi:MAG: protease complex subunit PrcB family protein [Coleofasciculus sp.]|uniref:protease complex subunit PrcB family protein n=1 Tax=Coleofasciculus sp. TaxID=3100458 RepID=UPI003A14F42D